VLEGNKEGCPERQTSSVRTAKKMITVFRGGATGRGTDGSGTLCEIILLLLKRKQGIDPFDRKQAFQKTE
jgi:hypothetical protein